MKLASIICRKPLSEEAKEFVNKILSEQVRMKLSITRKGENGQSENGQSKLERKRRKVEWEEDGIERGHAGAKKGTGIMGIMIEKLLFLRENIFKIIKTL